MQLGPVTLRNRVVSTAHGAFLDFYRPGEDPARYVEYQRRRAAGGVGLIILQPVHVHRSSQALGHHVYEPDDLRARLRTLAGAVHAEGAQVLIQLIHFGAEFRSDARLDLEPLWGMSPLTSATGAETAHEMTDAEIREVIAGYAATTRIALEAGLDGVEVHATHGYLVQQSYSPWGNWRDDRWGEPLAFVTAVLEAVRAEATGHVVGVRVSVDDYRAPAAGGLGPAGLRQVAAGIVDTGLVDYLNTSSGSRAGHYARAIASYEHEGPNLLPLAGLMRQEIGARVPVIGVGKITTPQMAEEALAGGACDLVAMTRAHIADPDVVAKYARGEGDRIRRCVGANAGCVDRMIAALPITCFHNPAVGRERELTPAARPRSVLIVGAGPAGLKAAETAARRGHRVRIVTRDAEPGGRLRLVHASARTLLGSVEWLLAELRLLGVDVETGVEAGPASFAAAEVVVLATGARASESVLDGDGSVAQAGIDAIMTGAARARRALVVDLLGTEAVAMAARRAAEVGTHVVYTCPGPQPCSGVGFTRQRDAVAGLVGAGVDIRPSTVATRIARGGVEMRAVYTGGMSFESFDLVIAGTAAIPDLSLRAAAENSGAEVHVAGDAVAPRSAMLAFREGADVGALI